MRPCDDVVGLIGEAVLRKREADTLEYWIDLGTQQCSTRSKLSDDITWVGYGVTVSGRDPLGSELLQRIQLPGLVEPGTIFRGSYSSFMLRAGRRLGHSTSMGVRIK
jgi:hypothetical protein